MRSILYKIILPIILYSTIINADSLFMTREESEMIEEFLSKSQEDKAIKRSSKDEKFPKITGIFYLNEEIWTVWINNIAYSSIGQTEQFSIDEVSENYVTLTMRGGETLTLSVSAFEDN